MGPAPRPFGFVSEPSSEDELDGKRRQSTEPVGREEQTATGMDVDDAPDTAFEKVDDDKVEPEQEGTLPEVLECEDVYASDDIEDDTEDEFEQQFKLAAHMYQATTIMSDEHIP